jgi:hypothetical protein
LVPFKTLRLAIAHLYGGLCGYYSEPAARRAEAAEGERKADHEKLVISHPHRGSRRPLGHFHMVDYSALAKAGLTSSLQTAACGRGRQEGRRNEAPHAGRKTCRIGDPGASIPVEQLIIRSKAIMKRPILVAFLTICLPLAPIQQSTMPQPKTSNTLVSH